MDLEWDRKIDYSGDRAATNQCLSLIYNTLRITEYLYVLILIVYGWVKKLRN